MAKSKIPKIGIIIGSKSDLPVVEKAAKQLEEFGISYEITVASAHRAPKKVEQYARAAENKYDLIIAAAGMSAALPGVVASQTALPVIGLPIHSKALSGRDALFSIVQMPPGVPVATVAIDGAVNAALLVVAMLAISDDGLAAKLADDRRRRSAS